MAGPGGSIGRLARITAARGTRFDQAFRPFQLEETLLTRQRAVEQLREQGGEFSLADVERVRTDQRRDILREERESLLQTDEDRAKFREQLTEAQKQVEEADVTTQAFFAEQGQRAPEAPPTQSSAPTAATASDDREQQREIRARSGLQRGSRRRASRNLIQLNDDRSTRGSILSGV